MGVSKKEVVVVYASKFVFTVLLNGHVQKELSNGIIPIPFGSEYGLRFRNKHTRRAVVKFTIDGEDASGSGYIINSNSAIDIHRHSHKDARFKFVSLESAEATDFGKNGPNDGSKGVIEARFYLEKEITWKTPLAFQPPTTYPPMWTQIPGTTWGSYTDNINFCTTGNANLEHLKSASASCDFDAPPIQVGCTVEGNQSFQTFSTSWIDLETNFVSILATLKGFHPEHSPAEVVFCVGCGRKKSRQTDNFCGTCGHKF